MSKEWILEARFLCRVKRRPDCFKDLGALERLTMGEQCPLEGRVEEIRSPHPADNVAGPIAAKLFPEPCSLCSKKPEPGGSDFDIRRRRRKDYVRKITKGFI